MMLQFSTWDVMYDNEHKTMSHDVAVLEVRCDQLQ